MCSFALSQLDFCNPLLIDINCEQMYRLQKGQNHAVKVVFHKSRYEHVRLKEISLAASQRQDYF